MKTPYGTMHLLAELQRLPDALRFERAARNPERAQRERLAAMVAANGATAFGRAHDLASVRTLADLQGRVPVQTYADLEPWVQRAMRGEANVLSSEAPVYYSLSTGTTGAAKYTPVTPSFRREFQRAVPISMLQVAARFPEAFRGSVLYFVGPREIERAPDGTPVGYTSGYNFTTLPPLVRRVYAWPYEVFEVKDLPTRRYLSAWLAALSPITCAVAVFPLALSTLLRGIEDVAEPLARDLERGTLRDDLALTPAEYSFFSSYARRDVRAAEGVRSETRANGDRLPAWAILPKLRLVYCWTSGSAGNYVPELKERLGEGVVIRDAMYAANEGWMNCTFGKDELGGPLSVTGHVYELVEVGAWDAGVRTGVGPHELEPGRSYRMLITNSAGLWRYDLGDIVTCTGYYRATAKIHFSRRSGASMDLAGEKTDEPQVIQAVNEVLARHALRADYFVARPAYTRTPPRYELLLELPEVPSPERAATLRAEIDTALGRINVDYGRKMGVLGRLALFVLSPGEHERERARKVAAGAPAAQLKVVHVIADERALAHLDVAHVAE